MSRGEKTTCQMRRLVDDHFAGRIRPPAEQQLRQHLPGCEGCRAHYERQMLLARLDPAAPPAEERMARGLGIRPVRQRPGRTVYIAVAATAALAAVATAGVMLNSAGPPPIEAPFQPRGGGGGSIAGPGVGLKVYSVRPDGSAKAVQDTISTSDELAFAYFNDVQKERLMVFGVDQDRKIHWYYPAWQDPAKNPEAVQIKAQPGLHELPHATRHELRPGRLTIHGIFTDQKLRVKQVEALVLQNSPAPEMPLFRSTLQVKLKLQVKR